MPRFSLSALALVLALGAAHAGTFEVRATAVEETKAVFGRIETRDVVPARPRIGGTLIRLEVTEGDSVKEGQRIARVIDDKLALQMKAAEARIRALGAERANAQTEFERAQTLVERGFGTRQRADQLRTQLDVIRNQISAAEAEKAVILQQSAEGDVLAPVAGRVLKVPVSQGAVVMPGEQIALIAGSGFFLRLALPERHAPGLKLGASVTIAGQGGRNVEGRLAKVFPQIENGRVMADIEMAGVGDFFVGARVLVQVPVGQREVLAVPRAAVQSRAGLDFVMLDTAQGPREVAVVPGSAVMVEGQSAVEILSGLRVGDKVVVP
jgi:RND family efflux transporter MFP subunit